MYICIYINGLLLLQSLLLLLLSSLPGLSPRVRSFSDQGKDGIIKIFVFKIALIK